MRWIVLVGALFSTVLLWSITRPNEKDETGMLGGFTETNAAANDEGVELAKSAVTKELNDGADLPVSVEVLKAEAQVVAGTNYRLLLKVVDGHANTRYYQANVWAKLPAHGGGHDVTSLKEISAEAAGQDGEEGPFDPAVDAAAAYAVQELSSRSNSLFPFQLKNVLSATKTHGAGLDTVEGGGSGSPREGVTHHLKLVVSRGQQPDEQYEIDVGEATHGFVLRGVHGPL